MLRESGSYSRKLGLRSRCASRAASNEHYSSWSSNCAGACTQARPMERRATRWLGVHLPAGQARDRFFERQRYRAIGLNLVTAAIVPWKTVYL